MRKLLFTLLPGIILACSSDYRIWIPRSASADPLYRFVKNGKAGYIDVTGKVVIPPTFRAYGNGGSEFHDGLLEIGVSDGIYADRTGKVVINSGLYRGWDFSEGLAVAMRKGENLWGYIDTSGKFAISPRFATFPDGYIHSFSNGLAMIEVKGKAGYINKTGVFAIPPQFLDGTDFMDGMARVVVEGPCMYIPDGEGCAAFNPRFPGLPEDKVDRSRLYPPCKFTYIDKAGHIITERRFDYARDFSEDLAPVRIGSLWGFADKKGGIAITPRFDDAESFSSGLSRVKMNGLYGYVDRTGKVVIAPQFRWADTFSDGFAVVSNSSSPFWYIDRSGKRSFPGDFEVASPFFKRLAHVQLPAHSPQGHTHAYIDTKGRQVFAY